MELTPSREALNLVGGYLRFIRQYLETIPIKVADSKNHCEISLHAAIDANVDLMLQLNRELEAATLPDLREHLLARIGHTDDKINRMVYQLYGLTDETTISHIYTIRGMSVMIDRDLVILYQVETKALNQAVRRNLQRFPNDFMFQLDQVELENWKSQIVTSKKVTMGLRKRPLVFTEQGIAMLSSVLNNDMAIQVNINIIRVFTSMRKLLETRKELLERLTVLEKNDEDQDKKIMLILDYLKSLEQLQREVELFRYRKRIGYKTGNELNDPD